MTMGRRAWIAAAVGLVGLSLPIGWARAEHVRIGVTQEPSTTVIVPAPASQTVQYVPTPPQVTVPMPQTISADQIKANQVRADTIYANRIKADQVVGQVHQTKDVKIGDTKGDIKAPEVAASVIYADEIKAIASSRSMSLFASFGGGRRDDIARAWSRDPTGTG